jgi:hypothetical protein
VGHEERLPPSRLNCCCRFGQATFAGTQGNGRDAPIADLHSTRAWGMPLSGSYAASLCLCIGLQLASSLIILCAPRVREPVGVIERG